MFLVLLLVVIGAAGVLKMIKATPGLFCESGNILLSDSGQKIEFPELNVSEEDVADGFYYQQLSEQELLVTASATFLLEHPVRSLFPAKISEWMKTMHCIPLTMQMEAII